MKNKISFLINNSNDLNYLIKLDEDDINNFLKNGAEEFILNVRDLFKKPNFDGNLRKFISSINKSINFISKLEEEKEIHKTIIEKYDFIINLLRAEYFEMYPSIFNDSVSINFYSKFSNMEMNTFINTPIFNRSALPGTEEYYKKEKLYEIFIDFNAYKIFFDFINLFLKNDKLEFSHTDASFLYRIMFEKKYIIESVLESLFRYRVYDIHVSKQLNFEKLKSLKSVTSIYREIIFSFVEKQNRSQKHFFRSQ